MRINKFFSFNSTNRHRRYPVFVAEYGTINYYYEVENIQYKMCLVHARILIDSEILKKKKKKNNEVNTQSSLYVHLCANVYYAQSCDF